VADVTRRTSSTATDVVVLGQPNHYCTVDVPSWQGNVVASFRLHCEQQDSPNQCHQEYGT